MNNNPKALSDDYDDGWKHRDIRTPTLSQNVLQDELKATVKRAIGTAELIGEGKQNADLTTQMLIQELDKLTDGLMYQIELHTKAATTQALQRVEAQLPDIPFVSFEACRTTADYDERQALRKLLKQVRHIIKEEKQRLGVRHSV